MERNALDSSVVVGLNNKICYDDRKELELLRAINKSLTAINARQETQELSAESNKLFDRSDARVENATNQIQNTFDRIHDKVFTSITD